MSFGRRKDGRYYRKRSRRVYETFPEPTDPPKRSKLSFFHGRDDDRRRKELEEFARLKCQEYEKRIEERRKKKKQERINKFFSLNLELGHAKAFLIKATPVLLQLDPTLSAVYTGLKVGKYGYCFLKQVNKEYKRTGEFEESLKTVTKQEVENKIVSKVKAIPTEYSFQYAANRIWTLCKERYSDGKIDPKWDNFAENALIKSFEEVGCRLL